MLTRPREQQGVGRGAWIETHSPAWGGLSKATAKGEGNKQSFPLTPTQDHPVLGT